MKKIKFNKLAAIVIILISAAGPHLSAQSLRYYVDSETGNDANDGLSTAAPWKTLAKVNSVTFQPGDYILLRSGGNWEGQLWPKGSGTGIKPITVGKYDFGRAPLINGNGTVTNAVYLFNQEYWTISDIEITNYKIGSSTAKRGVYIYGQDFGTIHNIKLINLNVHDVYGDIEDKDNGGIFAEITGSSKPTKFDSLVIDGCRIVDCDRTGISNQSSWAARTLTSNTSWVPSTNVIVKNNLIERSGGNGMIIRVSARPLIEYNVLRQCGLKTSGNALFTFNCDDALVQYNEASLTVYNTGDADASGFDSDYRCKRSVFQYNYSHDNDDGFLLVCCEGGAGRFNDSTVVRYNISQNDGGNIIRISGQTTNTFIYNNTVYSDAGNVIDRVIYHKSWSAYPDRTFYYNNIFTILKTPSYSFTSSTNNTFDYNIFYGLHASSEPYDAHKLTMDPKFENPGNGADGLSTLNGYKLRSGSPAIDAGRLISENGGRDFYGGALTSGSRTDIGAHEFNSKPSGLNGKKNEKPVEFRLNQNFPNPFNPGTRISFELGKLEETNIKIFNAIGQLVWEKYAGSIPAGYYEIQWNGISANGHQLPSGIYICSITAGTSVQTLKMILSR